jgi:hypothetical protein
MKKILSAISFLALVLLACEKKVEPVDGNYASVTLFNEGAKFVTGDLTINPGDSLMFSFTISSPRLMKYVGIQKNPVNQTAFVLRDTLTTAQTSYSVSKRLKADTANGSYLYRIVAHDAAGSYIGSKDIKVTVTPDFYYYTYRFLQVPDTAGQTNTAFMASSTGTVLSFAKAAAASAGIDFGVMYDTTGTLTASTTDDLKFCLFALTAPQGQLPFLDITSWTKSATIMKKASSPTFASLTSGGSLRSAGVTNLASGTSNKITQLVAGNLVYFKTAAGKVGCLQVNFVNGSSPAKDSYMNVDIKIER